MKTRMVSLRFGFLLLLSTNHLAADGVVNFNNLGAPPEGRIYRGDWIYVGLNQYQFVSWEPCAGANFHASLHWGPAGSTDDRTFIQVGPSVSFLTGTAAGMFLGGNRTIVTAERGPVLGFQVRAWEGAAPTYEQAILGFNGRAGKGPIFDLDTKDRLDPLEIPPVISSAEGWRGFIFGADGVTVVLVPEPSTLALAAIGFGALLVLRRRTTKH